ncbi:hypothetical protein [Zunongwangia sp. HRR-M8]|uniref:hypothetical protein n=1 Tax=Zunongwangia sp. HRR-M8 TaxID=3015170 RepID=UPI0022DE1FC1|nr:hypothetical protein [Zunongwangia sp. HRR-M8]WBL23308.1 hypothetical protein PBT89_04985 [Zunongwangia sp. HRR-M8]
MKNSSGYISLFTALFVVFALVYPYVHIFDHDFSANLSKEHHHIAQMDKTFVKSNLDCKICDFHFSGADDLEFVSYDIFIPLKESIYSLSLTQTLRDYPNPYFSLRAPPAHRV